MAVSWQFVQARVRGEEDPRMVTMQVQGVRLLSHSPDTQIAADTTQYEVQIRDKDIQ